MLELVDTWSSRLLIFFSPWLRVTAVLVYDSSSLHSHTRSQACSLCFVLHAHASPSRCIMTYLYASSIASVLPRRYCTFTICLYALKPLRRSAVVSALWVM